jgi:hypothetical protein
MGSRWVRTVVVIVALATLGFAGNQIRLSNATLADEQGGARVFTDLGWALQLTLAELRSAQQAYVADGQDGEYWASQVDAHLEAVLGSLDNLKRVANPGTVGLLDDAVATVGDIRDLDEEARGYTGSDQPLQASDLIFTRGLDLVDRATAHVQAAQQAERASRLDVMRTARANQARMMWTAVVVVVLSMLVLAPAGASSEQDDPSSASDEYQVAETGGLSLLALDSDQGDQLELPAGEGAAPADDTPPAADGDGGDRPAGRPPAPDLAATAALCTDFSNLTNQAQLPGLLARTASLMNASGLIIWVNNESARVLQPALEHGYASGTLERIGSIPQVGTNPTSTAFSTKRIQVVESEGSDTGALAAPLMVSDRCIGVLSAELREGWESSGAVQATASIVAAQLAPLLPADVQAAEPLAAATGTHDTVGADPRAKTTPSAS